MKEIWIAGYPSFYGGADTELLHNIDLWRQHDVAVNLVPLGGVDRNMRLEMDRVGCKTHQYEPHIFKDKVVASWCNGEFLSKLPEIAENGKPSLTVWANCMTFLFEQEKMVHRMGLIDLFAFVSRYQKNLLLPQLEDIAPVKILDGYRPYFNPVGGPQKIQFNYRAPNAWFAVGRLSRDDSAKYSSDMWEIFNRVLAPRPKKVFVLGWGDNAHKKCGSAPKGMDWQTWSPNQFPVSSFYNLLHCVIHKTGGSRESYCRIVPECYGYGVPIIVEHDYAFPDLVVNDVTGYMCRSSDEMSFRASELAFDETKRKRIIDNAHDHLLNEIANKEKCWAAWKAIL